MENSLDVHARELREQGFTIVPEVLDRTQVAQTIDALESIFDREKEIAPLRGWYNDLYRVAYMLPQKHPIFRSFPLNPRLLPLMQLLLGQDCLLSSLNGLTMNPGGENQRLHTDAPRTPFNVLAINALHCLDDFTRENGATRVVPKSQDREFDGKPDVDALEREAIYIEAPAGSLIAYNGGLLHAGSANKTTRQRRAIHAFFSRSWVKPQWDYSRSLSPDVLAEMSVEQKSVFGVDKHVCYYDPQTDVIVRNFKRDPTHKPARA